MLVKDFLRVITNEDEVIIDYNLNRGNQILELETVKDYNKDKTVYANDYSYNDEGELITMDFAEDEEDFINRQIVNIELNHGYITITVE